MSKLMSESISHTKSERKPKPTPNKSKVGMSSTSRIPNPTEYVAALRDECSAWAFDEERAPKFKGLWQKEIFPNSSSLKLPIDLEIGTGNGFHFAHYVKENPQRGLVGIELKYKPLIQTIRRALRNGSENMRVVRYNARRIDELFAPDEISDVLVHFPDPYLKKRFRKNRLLSLEFLQKLSTVQKSGCRLFFKTDSEDYFDWACGEFQQSPYRSIYTTRDLHKSEKAGSNFITAFEKIFTEQGLPTYYSEFVLEK